MRRAVVVAERQHSGTAVNEERGCNVDGHERMAAEKHVEKAAEGREGFNVVSKQRRDPGQRKVRGVHPRSCKVPAERRVDGCVCRRYEWQEKTQLGNRGSHRKADEAKEMTSCAADEVAHETLCGAWPDL